MFSLTRSHLVSDHFRRVQEMMAAFNQATPDTPIAPAPFVMKSRARLLVEEVLEFCEAAGIELNLKAGCQKVDFNSIEFSERPGFALTMETLPPVIDGLADISVVNIGTFVACGVPDKPVLECVDANNLLKVHGGYMDTATGKFIKPEGHKPPNIPSLLEGMLQAVWPRIGS